MGNDEPSVYTSRCTCHGKPHKRRNTRHHAVRAPLTSGAKVMPAHYDKGAGGQQASSQVHIQTGSGYTTPCAILTAPHDMRMLGPQDTSAHQREKTIIKLLDHSERPDSAQHSPAAEDLPSSRTVLP
jgi:hypothetical protein